MKAKFTTLAAFAAAAPALAAEQRHLLYTEGDNDGQLWTPADVWGCLLSSCEFEGLRPVRVADMAAAKELFLPIAEAALAAEPQVLVGDLVVELDEEGQPAHEPARLLAFDYTEAVLELNGQQWLAHRGFLRLHERQVQEACA